MMGNSVFFKGF